MILFTLFFFFNQSLSTTDLIAFLFFSPFCPTPLTYTVFLCVFYKVLVLHLLFPHSFIVLHTHTLAPDTL